MTTVAMDHENAHNLARACQILRLELPSFSEGPRLQSAFNSHLGFFIHMNILILALIYPNVEGLWLPCRLVVTTEFKLALRAVWHA
jgi:hypothetical protein